MRALFYHLTESGAAETLLSLVTRARGAGWRVMVRGTDLAALERLDGQWWLTPEDGFLPHGLEGGAEDGRQPVLLGTGAIGNAADVLALIDGAGLLPGDLEARERLFVIFDGNDSDKVQAARALWKEVTAAGVTAEYWAEDAGRWVKKSQSPPAGGQG
jgi:DNA polymerase III subunit chi